MKQNELYLLLQSAGLHPCYLGYEYFAAAVLLAAEDDSRLKNMRREIYIPIASRYQVSCSSVERDIRTARDVLLRYARTNLCGFTGFPAIWQYAQPYPRECIAFFAQLLTQIS